MPTVYIAPTFWRRGVVAGFVMTMQFTTVYDSVTTTWTDEFGVDHTDTVSVPRQVAAAAPGSSKGVLFAQGTMWRPAAAPTVPDMPSAGRWFLCYNTTHGLYWWGSQYGQYAGDAYLGWAVSDGTGVTMVSVTRLGDAGSGPITQVGGAVNQPAGIGVLARSTNLALTADATVSSGGGAPTNGELWVVRIDQDAAGGRVVTWDTNVVMGPQIDGTVNADPLTMCIMTFVGIEGKWYLCSVPLLGVPIV